MPFFDFSPDSPDRDLHPDEAWDRLPIVAHWAGLPVRWVGPLIDLGVGRWVSDFGAAGWGYLRSSGWLAPLQDATFRPERRDEHVDPPEAWQVAFARAVRILAEAGERAGPSGDPERWAAWVAFALHEPKELLQARYATVETWMDTIPDEVVTRIDGQRAVRSDFAWGPGFVAGDQRHWDPPVDFAQALAWPAQARSFMKACRVLLEDGTSVFFTRFGFSSVQQDVPEPGLTVPLRPDE